MTTSLPLAILDVGTPELLLIFFVILLLFGGQRLPELAKGLGKSIREFKKATSGVEEEIKRAMNEQPASSAIVQPILPRTVQPVTEAVVQTTPVVAAAPVVHIDGGIPATDAKL